jgi:hypothetical protein
MDDLPQLLLAGAHRRAVMLANGVTEAELRAGLWAQVHPRRYAWAATQPEHPRQRALVAASVCPDDGALGGWAAAFLLGARQLDGSTPDPDEFVPALVCMPRMRRRPWWDGVRPFRSELDAADVADVGGVRVTSPLRTAFDLARLASSLTEAVVALDVMARDLDVDPGEVRAYAAERRRWRGTPRARAATGLVDARSASPQESRFRMLWVLDAGLPRPLCNWPVEDGAGNLLGVVDLLDVDAATAGEYDGAEHAAPERRSLDYARQEDLERHRLTVVRAAGPDLGKYRTRTVQRLRLQHERGRRRDRARDRWVAGSNPPSVPFR